MSFTARTVTDRVVEHSGRYKMTLVDGTTDTYDLVAVPGTVTAEGTAINKEYLQPIEDYLDELDSQSATLYSGSIDAEVDEADAVEICTFDISTTRFFTVYLQNVDTGNTTYAIIDETLQDLNTTSRSFTLTSSYTGITYDSSSDGVGVNAKVVDGVVTISAWNETTSSKEYKFVVIP
jgi:hypothetical protein